MWNVLDWSVPDMQIHHLKASRYSINSSSPVGGNGYSDIYSPLKKNLGGALNKALVLNEVDRSAYLGHVGSSRSEDEEVWR